MSTSLCLLVAISLILLAGYLLKVFVRRDLARLAKLDESSRRYAKAVHELLSENVILPRPMMDTLSFWNAATGSRSAPREVSVAMMRIRYESAVRKDNHKVDEDVSVVLEHNPEVAKKYFECLFFAVMTISYSSRFWGTGIRAAVAELFVGDENKNVERFTRKVRGRVRLRVAQEPPRGGTPSGELPVPA